MSILASIATLVVVAAASGDSSASAPAPPSAAGTVRFLLSVGSNHGLMGEVPLRFAEDDAQRFYDTMLQFGGVSSSHARLVKGNNAHQLRATMAELAGLLTSAGNHTMLIVFLSGHGDHDAMHLSGEVLTYQELRALLPAAGLRLVFVDACSSGGITQSKGAYLAPDFDVHVESDPHTSGSVFIASSGAQELSFESEVLGGSFFSRALDAALRGVADLNGDGNVTLQELYQQVYSQTLTETTLTTPVTQHPTFDWRATGHGDVVLTHVAGAEAVLRLGVAGSGAKYLIIDPEQRHVVLELETVGNVQGLALRPKVYRIVRRRGQEAAIALADLRRGGLLREEDLVWEKTAAARLVAKGPTIDPHPLGVAVGIGLAHGPLAITLAPWVQLGLRRRFGPWELGASLNASYGRVPNDRFKIQAILLGGSIDGRRLLWQGRWSYLVVGLSAGVRGAVQLVSRDDRSTAAARNEATHWGFGPALDGLLALGWAVTARQILEFSPVVTGLYLPGTAGWKPSWSVGMMVGWARF